MINVLKEISQHFEELDKHEVNTPVKLRPVLRHIDAINSIPYAQSFALQICESILKTNNIFYEYLCKEFILHNSNDFASFSKEEKVVYSDLQALTKKKFSNFISDKLKSCQELEGSYSPTDTFITFKSVSNKRHKQEDRYFGVTDILNYCSSHYCQNKNDCPIPNLNKTLSYPPAALIGLFDGHNGPEAAEHCHRIAPYLVSHFLQSALCSQGNFNYLDAMADTFHSLNMKLNGCRNRYRWRAGTTSTMCLVTDEDIFTGWVGDSSAWLIFDNDDKTNPGQGKQIPLTDILHRPTEPSEVVDVWNNGGLVTKSGNQFDRVNGILAVTRALGDDRKIVGVSALPSVSRYRRTMNKMKGSNDELCILLASDGLWDSMKEDGTDVGLICRQYLHGDNRYSLTNRNALCQALVTAAIDAGASDNVTMVLMILSNKPLSNGSDARIPQMQMETVIGIDHHQDQLAIMRPRRDRRMSGFCEELGQLRQFSPQLTDYLQSHFSSDIRMLKYFVTDDFSGCCPGNIRAANDLICCDTNHRHHRRHSSSSSPYFFPPSLSNTASPQSNRSNHNITSSVLSGSSSVSSALHQNNSNQVGDTNLNKLCRFRSSSVGCISTRKRYSSPLRIINRTS